MNFIKKLIALIYLMCMLVWTTTAQSSVVAAEYFIDEEPGIGQGTDLPISASGSIDFDFDLSVESLELGIHALYLRTKQDNGLWSVPYVRYFFVIDPTAKVYEPLDLNLVRAEYFIDEDPGAGQGETLTINDPKSTNQDFVVTLTDQPAGLHFLYLRTLQDNGHWSVAKTVPFFVINEDSQDLVVFQPDIVAAEYFFDTDPGAGQGVALPLQKSASLDNRPWAASTEGLELGKHILNIRVQSQDGFWNVIRTEEVFVYQNECELPLANFDFDTVSVDTPINLSDISTNIDEAATYAWDLAGDGTVESTSSDYNPAFSEKGVYPLKLTVTNPDGCFTSVVKDVYITDGFPTAIELSANDSLFVGESLTLTAPEGFSYEWNTGETTESIEVTTSGEYFAWLTADGIHYKSETIKASFFQDLDAELKTNDATSGFDNGAAFFSKLDAGTLPYTIAWSTGVTGQLSQNDLAEGSYTVQVTTAMGVYDYSFDIASVNQPTEGIIAAEYFYTTDPGPGNGTPINIYQDATINYQWAPSLDGLEPGLNDIYIRVKQASGLWGFAQKKHFYVLTSDETTPLFSFGGDIVYAEYAIDDFPALGAATAIELTSTGESIEEELSIDVSELATGTHHINIRVKDISGNWSVERPYTFNICESVPEAPVIEDMTVCTNTSVQAVATGSAATFVWYDSDQTELKSSAEDFLDISALTESTNYSVAQYDEEGCMSTQTNFQVNVSAPQVFAGEDLEVLATDEPFDLAGMQPGTGGSWSGGSYVSTEGVFAPSDAGGGTFELTYSYDTLSCTVTDTRVVEVSKVTQTITVTDMPSELTYDQLPFTFEATASSALAVDLIADSETATADELTLSATALGVYSVQFEQTGNKIYLPVSTDTYEVAILTGQGGIEVAEQTVTHTGEALVPAVVTTPEGLNYSITYDGASEAPTAVGTYNVVVTIDEALYEGSLEFTYAIVDPSPDFESSSVVLSKSKIETADGLDVSGDLTNDGSADLSDDLIISYYLSSDDLLDGDDVSLGTETITGGLTVNETIGFGSLLTIPEATVVGDYQLLIVLDEDQLIAELDETNNLVMVAFEVFVNQSPEIEDQSFDLDENSPDNTPIGTVIATDPEETDVTFSIIAGNDEDIFQIDESTGELALVSSELLDYETEPSFVLTVEVSDGALSSSAEITVHVIDINEAPIIEGASFTINEEVGNNTVIGTLTATDPENDDLSYSITSGDEDQIFEVNTATGALSLVQKSLLDFDVSSLITLTVEVTDGNLVSTIEVEITIEKRITEPTIEDQSFDLDENSPNNTSVGTVVARGAEGTELIFSLIAGNDEGLFQIDASTGELTLISSELLDFETKSSFTLTVEVSDGTLSSSAVITVHVIDVNESPIIEDQSFDLDENSIDKTNVGTVLAQDSDGDVLTFSILSGNAAKNFAISTDGILTIGAGVAYDFETTPSILLVIEVTDGFLSSTAEVTIHINDVNEVPIATDQTFAIDENSDTGDTVGTIVASDPDNNSLTYTISDGNLNDTFVINSTSGELTVGAGASLDFETISTYTLTVSVSDGELSQEVLITISINDIEDEVLGVEERLSDFTVYPNPVTDQLVIENEESKQIKSIKLYDLRGHQVQALDPLKSTHRLDQLEPGVYILQIKSEGKTGYQRVIKN